MTAIVLAAFLAFAVIVHLVGNVRARARDAGRPVKQARLKDKVAEADEIFSEDPS